MNIMHDIYDVVEVIELYSIYYVCNYVSHNWQGYIFFVTLIIIRNQRLDELGSSQRVVILICLSHLNF